MAHGAWSQRSEVRSQRAECSERGMGKRAFRTLTPACRGAGVETALCASLKSLKRRCAVPQGGWPMLGGRIVNPPPFMRFRMLSSLIVGSWMLIVGSWMLEVGY
jgi:hypothetical protein